MFYLPYDVSQAVLSLWKRINRNGIAASLLSYRNRPAVGVFTHPSRSRFSQKHASSDHPPVSCVSHRDACCRSQYPLFCAHGGVRSYRLRSRGVLHRLNVFFSMVISESSASWKASCSSSSTRRVPTWLLLCTVCSELSVFIVRIVAQSEMKDRKTASGKPCRIAIGNCLAMSRRKQSET